jgi:hypothetical protein
MISYCILSANIIENSLLLFDQSVDMIQRRLTVKGTVMDGGLYMDGGVRYAAGVTVRRPVFIELQRKVG